MKPNLENEKFFVNLVRIGVLSVSVDGQVYNNVTQRDIGYINNTGYRALGYKEGKKVRHILIHRLVYLLFGNEILGEKQINHRNGVKIFNKIGNLEPATNAENVKHAWATGLQKTTINMILASTATGLRLHGENNGCAKLTNKQADHIRKMDGRISRAVLAKQFGISVRTISDITCGKTYVPRVEVRRALFFQRQRVLITNKSLFRFSSNWRRNNALDTDLHFN